MNRKRSIAVNASLNTIKTVLGILFPLITFPYIFRVLGVSNIGIYTFSSSYVSYFALISSLGISTYGIREGSRIRDDEDKIKHFVSELVSINLLSTIVAYILLGLSLLIFTNITIYRTAIIILSGEILFSAVGVSWVCNVYEDFYIIAIRSVLFQILSLILIFLLVKTEEDLNKYLLILLLSNSGANILNCFYIRRRYCKFVLTTHIDWKKHIKPILTIFSTTIAITIYVSSDSLILGALTNDVQVGLYGTAVKIYTITKTIISAVLLVMIPRFSLLLSYENKDEGEALLSKVYNTLNVFMLPMCVGLFMLSKDIVLIISGEQYLESSQPLALLSLALIFSLYSYIFTQCVLIPAKQEKIVLYATCVSALINIGLNFFAIPKYGISGAAITTIIAELITFIISFYYSNRILKIHSKTRTVLSVLSGCAAVICVCYLCKSIDNLYLRAACSIVISAIVYFTILYFARNPVITQLQESINKRFKHIGN